eukprot:3825797-Alexandrium_andersonii.AAC.1
MFPVCPCPRCGPSRTARLALVLAHALALACAVALHGLLALAHALPLAHAVAVFGDGLQPVLAHALRPCPYCSPLPMLFALAHALPLALAVVGAGGCSAHGLGSQVAKVLLKQPALQLQEWQAKPQLPVRCCDPPAMADHKQRLIARYIVDFPTWVVAGGRFLNVLITDMLRTGGVGDSGSPRSDGSSSV